jgi:arylsulfatase A-like enzyme
MEDESPRAIRTTLRRATVLGVAALAACARAPEPRSILLVTLDTTRADRLGCYGRADAGTPVIDALAAAGVRFERAYTVAPITLPAHATILTGAPPPVHGLRDNGLAALEEEAVTLAEVARAAGLRTAACVSAFPLDRVFGLAQGFEHYGDVADDAAPAGAGQVRERRADETVAEAREWLATLAPGEPFFLWVHLFDPHHPYDPPAEHARRFPDDPYQGEIAFVDQAVGELLAALDAAGRRTGTVGTCGTSRCPAAIWPYCAGSRF